MGARQVVRLVVRLESNWVPDRMSDRVSDWIRLAFFRGTTPWLYGLSTEPSLCERDSRLGLGVLVCSISEAW